MEKSYYPFHFFTSIKFMLLSCLMAYYHNMVTSSNITIDQSSLEALRTHLTTSNPQDILANNWTANTHVCTWIGVTCGSRNLRVISINLPNMAFQGTIPPEIGNLSFLAHLNMSNNLLSGNMPRELAFLRRLRVVDLSSNDLTGELPSSIFNMSSLEVLALRNNSLFGNLPDNVNRDCRVRELRLGRNMFQGQVPSTLHRCSQLRQLVLSYNRLSGVLNREIFNMTQLQQLFLGFNNFSGTVPQEIIHLQNLQFLGLENNSFTGIMPSIIFNVSSLTYLSLAYNHLSGSLPHGFANLTRLRTLYLSYNNFEGRIPEEIADMHQLDELVLQSNSLTGTIPSRIFNMSNVRVITFEGNRLSGNLPTAVSFNLPNLEQLYLARNNLQGQILDSLTNCTRLTRLDVSHNDLLSGTIPSSLSNLSRLRLLNLGGNRFTSDPELSFFTSLTNCRNLEEINLNWNPLNGTLPLTIGNFSTSLRILHAGACMITGEIPYEIGNLSNVGILALMSNDLSGNIPDSIRGLQNIQRLFLGTNRLTGSLPDSICTLRNMGLFDLTVNQMSGPIPECLGNNVSYLREIYLSRNRFDSAIPNSLWNLGDLSQLDLSSNFLRGSLSSGIGNLRSAIFIDVSSNELSGSIPSSIGGLQQLINLSLAHNRFDGSIPETMGEMLSLEGLDLSQNNLTGVIPMSLESLEYLNYFNISFNDLSGEIPSNGPFVNFTDRSFMFNHDLCGEPRFNVSPCVVNSNSRSRNRILIIVFASLGALGVTSVAVFMLILIMRSKKSSMFASNVSDYTSAEGHRRISYYELQQATSGFSESNLLGKGGFGSVYKGVLRDGAVFAVKVFNLEVEGALKSFDAECEVLKNLRHRNLTKIVSSCSSNSFKALILDYMPNGSLERWLYTPSCFLDIMQRLSILIDVACALDYLHYGYSTPVIHCDLKPSNVLLDEDMVAHVSDFGMAKLLSIEDTSTHTSTLATIGYMAPEYGTDGVVSPTCDVYSFGIMLMEVFTRTRPSDEYFSGDLTMKSWVQNSLPNGVMDIVDAKLLDSNEQSLSDKLQCLTSIFEVSISCTAEFPRDRVSIRDVLSKLNKIKSELLNCTSKKN